MKSFLSPIGLTTLGFGLGFAALLPDVQARDCSALEQLWQPRMVTLGGAEHWLKRVFTTDPDGDRQPDGLVFVLAPSGDGTADRILRLKDGDAIPAPLQPARTVAIGQLCFGQVEFSGPPLTEAEPAPFRERPDLQREAQVRAGVVPPNETEEGSQDQELETVGTAFVLGLVGLAASFVALLSGALFIARRVRRAKMTHRLERRFGQRRKKHEPHEGPERRDHDRRDS
ncbi:MAG: hypothetical protein ACPGOV_02450 [Magnetovibrionaceae bacterium]